MPLRPLFPPASSRLARVAFGVCAAVPLTLVGLVTAGIEPMAGASSAHVGPVYPAPGSGKLATTGADGQTGGITFSFSKVKTKKFKSMVWGLWYPKNPATWSFGLNTATLAFDGADSNLASGEAVYSGSAEFPIWMAAPHRCLSASSCRPREDWPWRLRPASTSESSRVLAP